MIVSDLVVKRDHTVQCRYDEVKGDQSPITVYGGYVPKSAAHDDRKNPEWQDAIRNAKYEYERKHTSDLTYAMIGERMGRILRRAPFSKQAVGLWFNGTRPQPENFIALAHVLEIPEDQIPALLRALASSPSPGAATEIVRTSGPTKKTVHGAGAPKRKRRAS